MLLLSRVTRRAALAGAAGALAALDGGGLARASARDDAGSGLAALERRSRGRLGVAVLDARGDLRVAHRGDERFPLCSTFKTLVAGLVLARADEGKENLARRVIYGESDLLDYAPVTKKRVGA